MNEPAYYRDLINQILETLDNETSDLPDSDEMVKRKLKNLAKIKNIPWLPGIEKEDDEFGWRMEGNWALPDGNHIKSFFCGPIVLDEDNYAALSVTVETEYSDEGHPYGDRMFTEEIDHILHQIGFPTDAGVQWSESGMQDSDYLHFDTDLGNYIASVLKTLNIK